MEPLAFAAVHTDTRPPPVAALWQKESRDGVDPIDIRSCPIGRCPWRLPAAVGTPARGRRSALPAGQGWVPWAQAASWATPPRGRGGSGRRLHLRPGQGQRLAWTGSGVLPGLLVDLGRRLGQVLGRQGRLRQRRRIWARGHPATARTAAASAPGAVALRPPPARVCSCCGRAAGPRAARRPAAPRPRRAAARDRLPGPRHRVAEHRGLVGLVQPPFEARRLGPARADRRMAA